MSRARSDFMEREQPLRTAEAGFTLIEALISIVVLVFGLIAVTNLLLVAATSNMVASQATAATTAASRILDTLKTTTYDSLAPGGDLAVALSGATPSCDSATPVLLAAFQCRDDVDGVGLMHVRWVVAATGDARLTFIQVQAEGQGVFSAGRTLADFTTFRSCTDSTTLGGCPAPPIP